MWAIVRISIRIWIYIRRWNGDKVEECESEDKVEELLKDLYPDLDGGTTHSECDDLLEDEPNDVAKFFYNVSKHLELPLYKIQKHQRFLLW